MKKGLIAVIAVVVLVCGGLIVYFNSDSYDYKATHLPDKTFINGVDCSGLTIKEAETELRNAWNKNTFTVNQDGKKVASFSMKDLNYDTSGKIEEFIGTNFFSVIKNHFGSDKKEHTIKMPITNSKAFDKRVMGASFLDIPYKVKTRNAYVNMDNTDFKIIKEVYGDNVDKEKVDNDIKKLIAKGKFEYDFDPAKNVDKPEIKKGDKVLKEEREFDKENYSQSFVYDRYNGDYRITPKDIKKMRPVDEEGNAKVDKKAVSQYMKDVLAWKVNTQYFNRKFKSTNRGKITVYGGSYGYVLDKKKEAKQLAKDLEANKDFKRKPIFSQKPYYTGKGENDIGDSYIEISIGDQTLWTYKNGKRIQTTAVTTGKSGTDTDLGVYKVEYKQSPAVLRGADYESNVSYWMPFNGGQGCHDAPWRGSFGGGDYVSNGSHGCVNMPVGEAAFLYSKIKAGYPVVVHE